MHNLFQFGASAKNSTGSTTGFGFGTSTKDHSATMHNPFDFGATAKNSTAPTTGFSFGATAENSTAPTTGFSFGTFGFGTAANTSGVPPANSSVTTGTTERADEQKKSPVFDGGLEVVGKVDVNLISFPPKYIWTIEELPERSGFHGVTSPEFGTLKQWRILLYWGGEWPDTTRGLSDNKNPSSSFLPTSNAAKSMDVLPGDIVMALVHHPDCYLDRGNHWKLSVKNIDQKLLKSFRFKGNFDTPCIFRCFVLPCDLARRIRSPTDNRRSLICEFSPEPGAEPIAEAATQTTSANTSGVPPAISPVTTGTTERADEQKKSPVFDGGLEVVGKVDVNLISFPPKYIWTIEELPERSGFHGVTSPEFGILKQWRMLLYSGGVWPNATRIASDCLSDNKNPPLSVFMSNRRSMDVLPGDIVLALVPDENYYLKHGYHWKLSVKSIDQTLLKSFRFKVNSDDSYINFRCFVLPYELAGRIRSRTDNRRSLIIELRREPGAEPIAEAATQTELTSANTSGVPPAKSPVTTGTTERADEQQISPVFDSGLEVVGKVDAYGLFFQTKYIWTIEELPERSGLHGVTSPDFGAWHQWRMLLYSGGEWPDTTRGLSDNKNPSSNFLPTSNLAKSMDVLPGDIVLALFHHPGSYADRGYHWKLSVKKIDQTLLKSFRFKGNFDTPCIFRYFVLPCDLARRIRSPIDNRRSLVCEFSLEPGAEPIAEAATQTTSGWKDLSRDLGQLLLSGEASDATVRVKGRDFPVHRCILAARTPVFSSMFRHQMSERETGLVDIEDCEPDTFERFLQHVYGGAVEDLSPQNASALYEVADKYQVEGLKSDCLECIRDGLSVRSVCEAVVLATRHGETELLRLASDFFALNVKDVIVSVEWQTFMAKNPTRANELLVKALHPDKK